MQETITMENIKNIKPYQQNNVVFVVSLNEPVKCHWYSVNTFIDNTKHISNVTYKAVLPIA